MEWKDQIRIRFKHTVIWFTSNLRSLISVPLSSGVEWRWSRGKWRVFAPLFLQPACSCPYKAAGQWLFVSQILLWSFRVILCGSAVCVCVCVNVAEGWIPVHSLDLHSVCVFLFLASRTPVRSAVVRPRQGRPGLGRERPRRLIHFRSWCGQQVPQPPWPGPHL